MSIDKALNDLAANGQSTYTTMSGADVRIRDDGGGFMPIHLGIDGDWFNAAELRVTAELLTRLANMLDVQGRGGSSVEEQHE